jgi:hypothetical protein
MKKRLSVVSKAAAAAQVLGISLLLMISCTNILAPPREATGNGETGTALISFGNGIEGARTLLPAEVTFERYDLTIKAVGHDAETVTDTVSAGSSAVVELTAGVWKIHVDAYTDTGIAAKGDHEFTVKSNETASVSVTLKAVSDTGEGTLSVDLTGEDSSVISYGWFYIYGGPDFNYQISFNNGENDVSEQLFWSSGLTLDILLSPGQYRIYAEIHNNEGQRAYINEVAWIYSNLTTPLDRVMEAGDFTEITVISGTVQYTENGVDQDNYGLYVFTNPEGNGYSLDNIWISSPGAEPYTLRIPRPDKDVTLYFLVGDGNRLLADSISLVAEQSTATKDISLNHSSITLSGSLAVTVDDKTPIYVNVYAYPSGGGSSFWAAINSDGTWTMSGIPNDFSGTLNFNINAEYNGHSYYASNVASWNSDDPTTTDILLTVSFVIISGSFTATENGNPISGPYVYVNAYRESSPGSDNFSEYLEGSPNSYWSENTCYWTFGTVSLSPAAQVQFRISISGSNNSATETVTVGTSNVTVPLKTYTFSSLILSGTIGTVRVNGQTPSQIDIYADTHDGHRYWASGITDSWEIHLPGDVSGAVTIGVDASYDGWHQKDIKSLTVSGSSVSDINLGDVDITFITLSGAIGTVRVNGQIASSVSIYVKTSDNNWYGTGVWGNNWQISLPGDVSGTVTIRVEVEYNGDEYSKVGATRMVSGSSVENIDLGNVTFTLSPMGGIVTTDGTTPLEYAYLGILNQPISGPEEATSEVMLGSANITGGAFSGYFVNDNNLTSGWVVVYDPQTENYWITSSSVPLGSSMNINLSTMATGMMPGPSGGSN